MGLSWLTRDVNFLDTGKTLSVDEEPTATHGADLESELVELGSHYLALTTADTLMLVLLHSVI